MKELRRRLNRVADVAGTDRGGCAHCTPSFFWIPWPGQERPTRCPQCGRPLSDPDPDAPTWTIHWPAHDNPTAEWRLHGVRMDPQLAPPLGLPQ